MNLNATLFGQFLTFGIFVWVMVKFVWPPIMAAMRDRQQKIGDGLAAAEKGVRDLENAKTQAADIHNEARTQATDILGQANKRGSAIIDEAKAQAQAERERILAAAHAEIEQERNRLREALRGEVSAIAIAGAGKILEREIDANTHRDLLNKLAAEL
ncbi:MAG: F0F1 ATP synthase subunit B [Gammaproteobacteria bacterium]